MKKLIMFAAMLAAVGMVAGCFTSATAYTETKHADGSVTVSKVKVIGTGDKASEIAAEGLFADGTQDDLGAGVETAKAKQQSTGIKEAFEGLGGLLNVVAAVVTAERPAASPAYGGNAVYSAPQYESQQQATSTSSGVLSGKVAEAKSNQKTLVVVAGNPQCGYCTRFEDAVNASTLPSRSDIVLVREIVPWESNSALSWTGGGDAPIVRVTSWNADGSIACDQKLNRPSIAEVEAAIGACVSK